jgi:hypothetical protein
MLFMSACYVRYFGLFSGQFSFKLEKICAETFKYWKVDLSSRQWEERKFLIGFQSSKPVGLTSGKGDEHSVRCLRAEEIEMRMK